MAATEIRKNIIFVGALDRDRRLFAELIPLPDGTSCNSCIVRGADKTALIDAAFLANSLRPKLKFPAIIGVLS